MQLSIFLVAPAIAWFLSQLFKYLIHGFRSGSFKEHKYLYSSGNMPSSHSAMMIALLTAIGIKVGTGTPIFGAVAVITTIVLYDAINVRRAVGEQAVALQKLQNSLGKIDNFYVAKGHTLTEVIAGSAVGLSVTLSLLKFYS